MDGARSGLFVKRLARRHTSFAAGNRPPALALMVGEGERHATRADRSRRTMMDLLRVLSELYESEINCGMDTFWDAGLNVWIGDELNGCDSEIQFNKGEFDKAAEWLEQEALRLYPDSQFAQRRAAR